MAIIFHEQSREFHLYNNALSYIIEIMDNGQLGNLYFGKKIHDRACFNHLHEEQKRSMGASHMESSPLLFFRVYKARISFLWHRRLSLPGF